MLYTGKGDDGQTQVFGCDQRLSKSSLIAEALGAVDEINSLLGWSKVKASLLDNKIEVSGVDLESIIEETQNALFSVQAEIAGADKKVSLSEVVKMEKWIGVIEKELPPIKSFLVAGGSELSAMFDYARTVARRAERRVIAVSENGDTLIQKDTLAFLNRLSSLLFALARLVNHRVGVEDKKPEYK